MASRRIFLSLPRLLLLVAAVLGAVLLHGEGAMARPLLGIAEPPASPGAVAAAGPGAAAQAGEGGRPDISEAGAEVILAGFAAAVIVVIFCYIRVTRESSSGVGVGEKHESLGGF
ncbi:unnamed protein product [Miscanthus lutarioriparius]|uniref:Uncharacterized protein n=1 Tax=Miscanthus lutarioriparius TaxID=422564 RepID=A0A811N0K9_9POAL|nr:unnamed protein product [Miscanthus lutarioriparius]